MSKDKPTVNLSIYDTHRDCVERFHLGDPAAALDMAKEISRLREELAAIATTVLHADVDYPGGCNLNEPKKLLTLVRYLASRAEESEGE